MLGVVNQDPIRFSIHLRLLSRVLHLSSLSTSSFHSSVSFAISSSSPSQLTATSLFQSYGFSDHHIDLIRNKQPRVISWAPERVQHKLDCFVSFGFSPDELATLISLDPMLLNQSAESRLLHNLGFLEKMLGSKKLVKKAIARSSRILKFNLEKSLMPNVDILQSHGVPSDKIAQAVVHYPKVMINKSDTISDVVNELKGIGMDPTSRAFIAAINAKFVVNKEKWDRKLELYRSFGWSDENFLTAFRKHPYCMLTSEWKIKKMMRFYVEKLGWSSVFLAQHPIFNDLSLENRIVPRCAVLEILASRELLEDEAALHRLLLMHGTSFGAKFVSRYAESIPMVVEAYQTKEPGDYPALKLWQERSKQKSILAGKPQF